MNSSWALGFNSSRALAKNRKRNHLPTGIFEPQTITVALLRTIKQNPGGHGTC